MTSHMRSSLLLFASLWPSSCALAAWNCGTADSYSTDIKGYIAAYSAAKNSLPADVAKNNLAAEDALQTLADPELDGFAFVAKASPSLEQILSDAASDPNSSFNKAVDAWEASRLDVQTGAAPTASGSTDLVAKAGLATLFSAAYDVGAFTQTLTGNTTTFSVNAGGLVDAIAHGEVICPSARTVFKTDAKGKVTSEVRDNPFSLHRVNATVSVDSSQTGSTTAPVTGTANASATVPTMVQLPASNSTVSAVSVKYAIQAPFDPRSSKFHTAYVAAHDQMLAALKVNAAVLSAQNTATKVLTPAVKALKIKLQQQYEPKFKADADRGDEKQLTKDFNDYFAQVKALVAANDSNFQTEIETARLAFASFANINDQMLEQARKINGYDLTLEGDYNHPAQQPETYTGRVLYSHPDGKALLSVNGAFTMYGAMPAGAKYQRLRDGQLSAEFDTPLGNPNSSIATLTGAFYMQYQTDPSVLNITAGNLVPGTSIALPANAQVLLGPSGLIVIGQGKLTIKTKSGISIPLAVEYANKTDLLNATDVRGNIGISYDFSSFSSLFGAKTK